MLKLHGYYLSGAVVQRGVEVPIKGYTDGSGLLTVTLSGGSYSQSASIMCEKGNFCVFMPPLEDTSCEYLLRVEQGAENAQASLLAGDVYLSMGQSNMSYPLSAVEDNDEWIERAKRCRPSVIDLSEPPFADISEVVRPYEEQEDLARDYSWRRGDELMGISAISVEVATALSEQRDCPIGFVHTAMGGLGVEAYLRRQTAEADAETVEFLKSSGRYQSKEDYNNVGARNYSQLSGVWNEKIAPLKGFAFKGIVWYLGESSAWDYHFARQFLKQLKMVFDDCRKLFGNIPFVAVHIAPTYYPYGDKHGYLYINEALTELEEHSPLVTALPIYDIEPRWLKPDGDEYFHPIHPVNKSCISNRVAKALDGDGRYPSIVKLTPDGGRLICKVKGCKKLKEAKLYGFTVAGEDGKYYPAQAKVVGVDEIELTSIDVPAPTRATYAFTQYQDFCNAADEGGKPLLPYRSQKEPVHRGYCFTPAFTAVGKSEVYENCFGWSVGTCRRVLLWKKGVIYDASPVKISFGEDVMSVSSTPLKEKYKLFGVSPEILLAGHKNHLSDYEYISVKLSAEGAARFLGCVVRAADGDVYRLKLLSGNDPREEVSLSDKDMTLSLSLAEGTRGDSAPVQFTREMREGFAQMELLFRAESEVTVFIKEFSLTDINRSQEIEREQRAVLSGSMNLISNG